MTNWTYGWNRPGYMPDTVEMVDEFEDVGGSWEATRDALIWELERWEGPDPEASETEFAAFEARCNVAIDQLRNATPEQPIGVLLDGWIYFIAEA